MADPAQAYPIYFDAEAYPELGAWARLAREQQSNIAQQRRQTPQQVEQVLQRAFLLPQPTAMPQRMPLEKRNYVDEDSREDEDGCSVKRARSDHFSGQHHR